jgi:hypothetical protein
MEIMQMESLRHFDRKLRKRSEISHPKLRFSVQWKSTRASDVTNFIRVKSVVTMDEIWKTNTSTVANPLKSKTAKCFYDIIDVTPCDTFLLLLLSSESLLLNLSIISLRNI